MGLVDRLYDWLAAGPTPECDRVLGAALDHAEPEYFERIRRLLFARGHEASWAALIAHFEALTSEDRQALRAQPDRARSALGTILRGGSPPARLNALAMLADEPSANLAYALPDVLRDASKEVRRAAALVLHKMTGAVVDRVLFGDENAGIGGADPGTPHTELVRALREGLRTFELHCRMEAIEASLWMARQVGELLWYRLDDRKSQCGRIVEENLELWDSPRLAGFLLESLARPPWRPHARRLLPRWRAREHLIAVLRHSDLLADPHIRRHLAGVRNPNCFAEVGEELSELPPALRAYAPAWVCHLGFTADERVTMLSRWSQARDEALQRAALDALAGLESPAALRALGDAADARGHASEDAVHSASAGRPSVSEATGAADAAPASEFELFWQLCRRRASREHADLIEPIREQIDLWRPRILGYLRSDDARDRILALRTVGTVELTRKFGAALVPLLSDPVEGIQKLAMSLVEADPHAISREPIPDDARRVISSRERWPALGSDEARGEYRTLLARLLNSDLDAKTASVLIERVWVLLKGRRGTPSTPPKAVVARG